MRISIHIFTSSLYSNVTTSTRINSTKCTYVHLCLFHLKCIQYSTWCQNKGCICISSTRRTYRSNPAVSCIYSVIQTRNIILQTELILQEEGKREIQCYFSVFNFNQFKGSSSNSTVFPHAIQ